MLEIFLVLAAMLAMAKHKPNGKRYSGKWFFPRVNSTWALGTLASEILISLGAGTAVIGRVWLSSVKFVWSIHSFTVATGDGPITVGIAHSDYTDVEIEEWLEATGSMGFSDKVAQERARRKCRVIGIFPGAAASEVLNDGRPIKTKCGWYLEDGQSFNLWAFNEGSSPLTTGALVSATGNLNLRLA